MRKPAVLALSTVLVALAVSACGPSEQEFTSSCLASCGYQARACGIPVDPLYGTCGGLCDSEWAYSSDKSTDCVWYMVYYWHCADGASCESLTAGTACLSQLADVVAECGL